MVKSNGIQASSNVRKYCSRPPETNRENGLVRTFLCATCAPVNYGAVGFFRQARNTSSLTMQLIIGWETPVNRAVYLCFGGSSWAVHRLIFLMTSGERIDEALRYLAALAFCCGFVPASLAVFRTRRTVLKQTITFSNER